MRLPSFRPCSRRRSRRRFLTPPRERLLLLVLLGLAGAGLVATDAVGGPRSAEAAVAHGTGFSGVVDGFRSWYGSYRLGEHGEVWCIDHAIPAPDVVLGYEPTGLEERAPETRRALAWAVGRHGRGADRVTAAALMLVLHDLMGAAYPSGPLSVDALSADRLSGFDGHEAEVVEAARRIKADAVARAHLIGPMVLSVEADQVAAGRVGEVRAVLGDTNGAAVEGVVLHPAVTGAELVGAVDQATAADGQAVWAFTAAAGANRFDLTAVVPGADLLALRPTHGRAQRVVRPASATVAATTSFDGVVPRHVTIHKRGDTEPLLPVAGARFAVDGREVTVGADGRTPPIEVLPGTYLVTELEAPPGYATAGPWTVVVHDADVVLDVLNHAIPGRLTIEKVDRDTGAALTGARFEVRADADGDPATFEAVVHDGARSLRPGRYEVREVDAPPHHRIDPVPRLVDVRGGEETVVRWENAGLATVGFEKRPPLAGAVFVVRAGDGAGEEAGRCTTGDDGRCALPDDVLDAGAGFCWEEAVAPPGWGLAEGACATTGTAGTRTVVTVDEPPLPVAPPPVAPPAPEPELQVAAGPPAEAPPPTSTTTTAVPAAPGAADAPELPRTGGTLGRWAGLGLILIGAGLLLVVLRQDGR